MKKRLYVISQVLYSLSVISALLIGLFSDINYCPYVEFPILFINVFLFGLIYFLNRDDKLRLNLFSVETVLGYLGIMFLFTTEQSYGEMSGDSFMPEFYSAAGTVEIWLLAVSVLTIVVNILGLIDKRDKFKKLFSCYYTFLFAMSIAALIYLSIKSFDFSSNNLFH